MKFLRFLLVTAGLTLSGHWQASAMSNFAQAIEARAAGIRCDASNPCPPGYRCCGPVTRDV
ncbi:hypothetical protein BYT27DRAFT_7201270 [Phlegmacium glaucopus]|nr:hypothetical protein BYT27DRAFT_7201270 [Phlegmacium glaucopus]